MSTDDEVIWTRVAERRPGRRPSLTHDQIARAGITIADAEGLDAVTMRRVAATLGAGTMSLYRYVATRNELIELMVDAVTGEMSMAGASPGWRANLTVMAHQVRQLGLRHPWVASGIAAQPSMGPNVLRWIEETVAPLDLPGLSIDQILDMGGTVTAFVAGYVQGELAQQQAQRATGLTEQQWRGRMAPYVRRVIASGQHPYLERIVVDAEDFPDPDAVFSRRLGYVLDGLAAGLGLT